MRKIKNGTLKIAFLVSSSWPGSRVRFYGEEVGELNPLAHYDDSPISIENLDPGGLIICAFDSLSSVFQKIFVKNVCCRQLKT